MSDYFIVVIPENPWYLPQENIQQKMASLLRQYVQAEGAVRAVVSDAPVFHDCGADFESVQCPFCRMYIDLETWHNWMDNDYSGYGFRLGTIDLHCCGKSSALHMLDYSPAQGFGRFALEVMNPVPGVLNEEQVLALEGCLGDRIRIIYRHV